MTFRFRKCQMKTTKLFLFSLATVLYNHAATSVSCTRSTLSPWRNLHYCSTHFSDCKICMNHSVQHGEQTNNHWSSDDAFLKPPQPLTDKFIIVLHSCHISPLIFNCHSLTSLYCPHQTDRIRPTTYRVTQPFTLTITRLNTFFFYLSADVKSEMIQRHFNKDMIWSDGRVLDAVTVGLKTVFDRTPMYPWGQRWFVHTVDAIWEAVCYELPCHVCVGSCVCMSKQAKNTHKHSHCLPKYVPALKNTDIPGILRLFFITVAAFSVQRGLGSHLCVFKICMV